MYIGFFLCYLGLLCISARVLGVFFGGFRCKFGCLIGFFIVLWGASFVSKYLGCLMVFVGGF
jgi:hypothetical protein